jgi:hypothetical protein
MIPVDLIGKVVEYYDASPVNQYGIRGLVIRGTVSDIVRDPMSAPDSPTYLAMVRDIYSTTGDMLGVNGGWKRAETLRVVE